MFRNKQIKNMNPNEDKWSQLNDSQKNKISLLLKKKKAKKANDGNTYTNIEKSSLSLSQRRIWFLQHMNRNDVSYNMPFSIKLVGNVNFEILQKSFNIMFKCNDSLRMCFPSDNGIPIIKIEKEVIPNIKRIDVENEKEAELIFIQEASKPFDIEREMLYRIILATSKNNESYLLFVSHHIVFDGISSAIFIKEFSGIYNKLSSGEQVSVEQTRSYLEYISAENEWMNSDAAIKEKAFWHSKLEGELPILDFPYVSNDNIEDSGRRKSCIVDEDITNKLHKFAVDNHITDYTVLLAAYGILLNKYTHKDDLIIGTPFAGRYNLASRFMIGNFVNTLPVRVRIDRNTKLKDYIIGIWNEFQEVYAHQRLPFDELVNFTRENQDASVMPIYQTLFVYQNYFDDNITLNGAKATSKFIHNNSKKFDISLSVGYQGKKLECVFEYNPKKIPDWMINNILEQYVNVLKGFVQTPDMKIKDFSILSDDELNKILYSWNDTKYDFGRENIIYKLFEEQVDKAPDAIALMFNDKSMTYKELDIKANKVANFLIQRGVKTDELVGILMNRSFEMVIAIYGIIKSGAAYVPIDPEYPLERIKYINNNANMSFIFTQTELKEKFSSSFESDDAEFVCLDDTSTYDMQSETRPEIDVKPDGLVYMIYTSGSTGNPKGVMNTNEALQNRVLWMQKQYNIMPMDRVLQKTPYCFDVSVWEFVWPLITGGTLVIAEPGGHRDPVYLLKMIQKYKINMMHFVPSMLNIFLMNDDFSKCDSLKKVFCSGEALNYSSVQKFNELLPNVELHNLYGPTEAAIDVTYWDCSQKYDRNVIPIGYPINNISMYILDEELNPVPVGTFGELYIGGIGLARGYYNKPELTNEKFIKNPFKAGENERIYQTGDIGRYNNSGVIEYYKRKDLQVKLRGQRVELGEIEAAIEMYPNIEQAAAVVFTDNNNIQNLMAFIVLKKNEKIDFDDLKQFIGKSLAKYMIPSFFNIIDEMPITINGKVNRKLLQGQIVNLEAENKKIILPRNKTEEKLHEIFLDVFSFGNISVDDDIISMGVASLSISSLAFKIKDAFGIEIEYQTIYDNSTIEKLAIFLDNKTVETVTGKIDLKVDVDEILKQQIVANYSSESGDSVLLTGATGFVGAFLLFELQKKYQKIYTLVRAENYEKAEEKLKRCLDKYKLGIDMSRIDIVLGDLSRDNLGIDKEKYQEISVKVGYIIHCGALVNYSYDYRMLRSANVLSVDRISKLAVTNTLKKVYYISSLHVFSDKDILNNSVIYEGSEAAEYSDLKIGYSQSKWSGEQVLMRRSAELGFDYKIFRLGRVGGAEDTGVMQENDLIMLLLGLCIKLKSFPDVKMDISFIPVDFVAKFITNEVHDPLPSESKIYHIYNHNSLTSEEVFDILKCTGIQCMKTSLDTWLMKFKEFVNDESQAKYSMIYELIKKSQDEEISRNYNSDNFESDRKAFGLEYHSMDADLLKKYLKYNMENG